MNARPLEENCRSKRLDTCNGNVTVRDAASLNIIKWRGSERNEMASGPVATPDKAVKTKSAELSDAASSTVATKSAHAILLAAIDEFSERGFEGARMEAIAQRAGYNKSLAYRHFADKMGLFEAVLRHKVEQRTDLAHRMPDELAAALEYWFEQSFGDPHYLRLLIREALNDKGGEIVEESSRRAYYQELTNAIAKLQETRQVSEKYDPAMLNLVMTAVTLFPIVFPQLTRLITRRAPGSRAFKREWKNILRQLAEDLKVSDA